MNNQLQALMNSIKQRMQRGKDDAFLFVGGEQPILVHNTVRYQVIEYAITFVDSIQKKSSIVCLSPIETQPDAPVYSLLFDNHGSSADVEDHARFILFQGNEAILSSLDRVKGMAYICATDQASKKAVGISFSIAAGPRGRYTSFVCDGDINYIQYLRVASLLANSSEV